MNTPPPCASDCKNRSAECHSVCKEYIEWYNRRKEIKSKINKKKELDRIISKGN